MLLHIYSDISSLPPLRPKQLIAYLLSPGGRQRQLEREIAALRAQLATLSMTDNYIEYVKLERRINAAEKQRTSGGAQQVTRTLLIRYGLSYGSQVLLSLVLVAISILYRYVPVIVLGDQFNFAPFAWLMRFPTGVTGAVSVPFWIFVSSFAAKNVASMCGQ